MSIRITIRMTITIERGDYEVMMYNELAGWWHLLSSPEEYAQEAEVFRALLMRHAPRPRTLLELGSGGGNNAWHLKKHFELTLTDLSEDMLAASRNLNPECEHAQGDMRALRLGKVFDAVFVHDAICYMTSEAELRSVFETAFVHLKEGGVALFAPDWVRETFHTGTDDGGNDDERGGVRYMEWVWDADPNDALYNVEYIIAVRDGNDVRVYHDRHVEGIFAKSVWLRLLDEVGFEADAVQDPNEAGRVLFVGKKR